MKKRAIIFDLDGTLLDTVPGLMKSMNEILAKYNFPLHGEEDYKRYIGNGIKSLVDQSVPHGTDEQLREELYKQKSQLYSLNWKEGTSLFPGIIEMLDEMTRKDIILTIFSNKEDEFTQQIAQHFLSRWKFVVVLGRTNTIPKKPDPAGFRHIMSRFQYSNEEWICAGDKDADIQAARNANIEVLFSAWGYQKEIPPDVQVVYKPSEIISYFE